MYVAVGHCVCLAISEMERELGVNSGLTSFVIVIVIVFVIGCHYGATFFLKSGTLILGFSGII